ncbi:hypothetical protein FRX31_017414 [Thalictrum thalictroides]|uniref:Uncharacterized protein n=1 Tax=Thalictrum thalictroides TaxID=46969 RepID=A0A7J6W7T1_THATH|nr:hypothetical protein FRX31_017414 [Thalictrum thalictroides]
MLTGFCYPCRQLEKTKKCMLWRRIKDIIPALTILKSSICSIHHPILILLTRPIAVSTSHVCVHWWKVKCYRSSIELQYQGVNIMAAKGVDGGKKSKPQTCSL